MIKDLIKNNEVSTRMINEDIQSYIMNLSDEFTLDLKPLEREGIRMFFGGMSGSGKSNGVKVCLEELIKFGFPLLIIDLAGEYASLNEVSDKVLIIGGKYADLPLEESLIDDLVGYIYEARWNVIFDLSGLRRKQKPVFVEEILEVFYSAAPKYRTPVFLVIEECKHIAPQDGKAESSDIAIEIASEGRKFGIHQIWITQRTAMINKNVLSECNVRFFGKSIIPNDLDKIKDILKHVEINYQDVRELDQEFFLVLKDKGFKVKFRKANITDLANTPLFDNEISLLSKRTGELASVIQELKEKLEKKKKDEKDESNQIKLLEKEREKLEETIENLEKELEDTKNELERTKHDLSLIGTLKVVQESAKEITVDTMKIEKLSLEMQQKEQSITTLKSIIRNDETKIKNLEEQLLERNNAIEQLTTEMETFSDFGRHKTEITKHVKEIGNLMGIENITPAENEEVTRLREELRELKQRETLGLIEFKKRIDFIKHPIVRESIRNVKEKTSSKNIIDRILSFLVENEGPATYQEIQQAFGYKDATSISKAAVMLEKFKLITRVTSSNRQIIIDLDLKSLAKIDAQNRKKEMLDQLSDHYKSE